MNSFKNHIILLFMLIYAWAVPVYAQAPDSFRFTLYTFEDKHAQYTIQDIIKPDFEENFVEQKSNTASYAFTKSVIWCKIDLKNTSQKELFINIRPKILNTVAFYELFPDNNIDSTVLGTLHILPKNKEGGSFIFRLSPNAVAYYLKIKTNTRLFFEINVKTEAQILSNKREKIISGFYIGLVLMIFIYNLFLFITSADRIYLYYLLHLSASLINFLYLSGIGNKYIWTNQLWVSRYFISIMSFGFVFSNLFAIKFLDTRNHSKILHKGMLIAIILFMLIGISDLSGFHLLAVQLLNIIGFLIILYIIFSSVIIMHRGYKPAGIFLSAWIFYFFGISLQVLQGFNLFPTNIFTSNGMIIGSAFEITLLSLSIGYKINFLKNQMYIAALNEQKALKEKEKLMLEEGKQLEQKAEEQSEQIKLKNQELKKQYNEILSKNKKIKQQNEILHQAHQELEEKNKIIENQHELLIYHKNNLEDIISERTGELQKLVKKVKEADNAKTAFLRDVSHEIRTPMNAIAGFAGLLFNIDPKDQRHDYYVDIIFKNTENLQALIENIIDLSKIQTESLQLKKVRFYLSKMFLALNEEFKQKLRDQNKFFVSINVRIPEDEELIVKMDYNRLWQVLYHLIDNSVKYTDTGFIDFGYEKNAHNELEIVVKDSGRGIPKQNLNIIFDQFRKTGNNINKIYSGTGLGLSLVKGLVSLMNGTITVSSLTQEEAIDKNPGTTFTLIFKNVFVQ